MNAAERAYRDIAAICRGQINDVRKSGWSSEAKECAELNLKGMAEVCDQRAENEALGIG